MAKFLSVKEILKRKFQKGKTRPLRALKPTRPQHPQSIERDYYRALSPIRDRLLEISKKHLSKNLPKIIEEAARLRPDHVDSYSDDIRRMMKAMKLEFSEDYTSAEYKAIAARIAKRTSDFNASQIDNSVKKVLDVDYFSTEPWLKQEIKSFTIENVKLIKTIPEEYFGRIEQIVTRGARTGQLQDQIASEIDDKTEPWSEARLKFIARDQVSKFNGDLTQLRQTNIGIKKYQWSTSHDERVRETHRKNDGKIFSWDDPPAETGHPGDDYQCRCVAIAYFEELVSQAQGEAE